MKLKAYSRNSPVKHLVFHTLKRFFWLPLIILVITAIAFIAPEVMKVDSSYIRSLASSNSVKYLFKNTDMWSLYPYFLMCVSALSAFVTFSFLFKKKSASVMMLTGVSRTALFITKYVFGLVSVLVPTFISFILLLSMAASYVGDGVVFGEYTPYMLFIFFGIIVYSYTVAVISAVLCGRMLEFFAVCGVMYFGVQGLMLFSISMLASFLHGFAYAMRVDSLLPYTVETFFDDYSFLSVNTLFKEAFKDYPYTGYPAVEISPPDFGVYVPSIVWLIVIGLLLIPLALLIFKRRNSEFDGKPNGNKIVSAVCTVIVALTASSLVMLGGVSFISCAGALALFAVLCFAIYAFFEGGIRTAYRSFKFALPCMAAICVIGLALYIDIFGYSSKIPDIDDVESVTVSYEGNKMYFSGGSHMSGMGNITATTMDFDSYPALTSKSDIKTVTDIHKKLIEDGSRAVSDANESNYSDTVVYADYYIVYKLKNGDEMVRCYPQMKLSTLYQTLAVDDTETYRANREKQLKDLCRFSYKYQPDDELSYEGVKLHISDNMASSVTPLDLTPAEVGELAEALAHDKSKAGFEALNHPSEECLGVIWTRITHTGGEITDVHGPVCVYKWDTETVSWLTEKGLDKYFEPKYTVKSVKIYDQDYFGTRMTSDSIDRYFMRDYAPDSSYGNEPVGPSVSVDEKDFDEVLKKCRMQCFMDGGNRFALITLVNSDGKEVKVTKYLMD